MNPQNEKFKSDYKSSAYLRKGGLGGWKLYHIGGKYGVAATEAIMKAVPHLEKQKHQSLDGYELWFSDDELLAAPHQILHILDDAGVNVSHARIWLEKKGVEL